MQLNKSINWHAAYTTPNFERKVESLLLKIGIETFLPRHYVVKQWSDRKKRIEVPLFTNYIFVRISPIDRFRVLGLPGVIRFVCTDKTPDVISAREIDLIRNALAKNPTVIYNDYKIGDRVRVVNGPFAGIEGFLENKKGQHRLGIKMSCINSILSVDISKSEIVRLEECKTA